MKKVLDLNTCARPTLELTLQDEDRTQLSVTVPTEGLVRELEAVRPELAKLTSGDRGAIDMIYDLAARLISCNLQGLALCADDLRGRYRMNLESAILFFSAYLDFISEITNSKN